MGKRSIPCRTETKIRLGDLEQELHVPIGPMAAAQLISALGYDLATERGAMHMCGPLPVYRQLLG